MPYGFHRNFLKRLHKHRQILIFPSHCAHYKSDECFLSCMIKVFHAVSKNARIYKASFQRLMANDAQRVNDTVSLKMVNQLKQVLEPCARQVGPQKQVLSFQTSPLLETPNLRNSRDAFLESLMLNVPLLKSLCRQQCALLKLMFHWQRK